MARRSGSDVPSASQRPGNSQIIARGLVSREPLARNPGVVRAADSDSRTDPDGTWRCLEWADRPTERARRRDSGLSVAQLTTSGELLRQRGDQEWLPEASEFVHRLALRVAQGLGFDRCHAVCLRGAKAVLSVSEAGPTTIVAVTGPTRAMGNVLRRMGLE
jgi:hypothetical protein